MRLPLVLAVALQLSVIDASAQSATFARTDYPFLGNDHIAADLNRDGRTDLVGTGVRTVRVMLGNGDGSFQPRVEYPVSTSAQPQAIAAGDFNRDGVPDVVVSLNDPVTGVALITGVGDGSFNPPVAFPNAAASDAPAIAAVDLDNDQNLDVVVGHGISCYQAPCVGARWITVMRGRGDGTFHPASVIDVGSDTAAIGVANFNRDAFSDLVLAGSASRVHVLLGRGDGTFVQQTLTLVAQNNLGMDNTDIDVADVNGDQMDDVVVALSLNGSRTVILVGNGDGSFRAPHVIQEPDLRIPQYQAVADYNGDGRLDLALSLGWGSQGLMEIRNGNGDGTFGPLVLYLVPPDQSSIGGGRIVAADFNGDGKSDIALGWTGASIGLAVLRNTTGSTPPPRPAAPSLVSPGDGTSVAQPVTLDWTDVAHASAYEVQVDNSSTLGAPFVANVMVTASQVTLTGLPAQRLWWRVRARNSAGVFGPFSSVRRFTPQSTTAPPPAPAPGGQAATLTVTATGRSGERVLSSPSGISVTVGTTGSATFGTGTSITLSVTNGRDAIWSGACSSSGDKRRTCTFTLNGNATVTANVQ
jgi:hypothetical protein